MEGSVKGVTCLRHARLAVMSSEEPLRVTVRGDRAGDYVVAEERHDGSLVLVPDRSAPRAPRPKPPGLAAQFSSLLSRAPEPRGSVTEALGDWGVELGADERVREFMAVTIDGRPGFLALTTRRLIFIARGPAGLVVRREAALAAARDVELVRHRMRRVLRVRLHDDELLIRAPGRDSLARLRQYLEAR